MAEPIPSRYTRNKHSSKRGQQIGRGGQQIGQGRQQTGRGGYSWRGGGYGRVRGGYAQRNGGYAQGNGGYARSRERFAGNGGYSRGRGRYARGRGGGVQYMSKDPSNSTGDEQYPKKGSLVYAQFCPGLGNPKLPGKVEWINPDNTFHISFTNGDVRAMCPLDELTFEIKRLQFKQNNRKQVYNKHISFDEAQNGFKNGILHQGIIKINSKNANEAYLTTEPPTVSQDICIVSRKERNRAFDGDRVFVKLNPKDKWKLKNSQNTSKKSNHENVSSADNENKLQLQPTGEVVFIFDSNSIQKFNGYIEPLPNSHDFFNRTGKKFNENIARFVPLDCRSPYGNVKKKDWPRSFNPKNQEDNESTMLYTAQYEKWEGYQRQPNCVIVEILESKMKNEIEIMQTKHKHKSLYKEYINTNAMTQGIKNESLYEGVIHINPKNANDAYVKIPTPENENKKEDIYIQGRRSRNRAYNEDRVVVKLLPKSQWKVWEGKEKEKTKPQPTGEIVYILKEKKKVKSFPGYLEPLPNSSSYVSRTGKKNNEKIARFVPLDKKVPWGYLSTRYWPKEFNSEEERSEDKRDILYLAKYDKWEAHQKQPSCILIDELGLSCTIQGGTKAILEMCEVDYNEDGIFDDEILDEIKKYEDDWQIPPEEISRRLDLRNSRIFSIDPKTARDLDDALSVTVLEDNRYRIGVHIADVSYFIKEGTKVDKEAAHRATTIYMIQKAIPMLPGIFSHDLCSLNPMMDKLAYSVFWEMTGDGRIVDKKPWFRKSIIRSCCKLHYDFAQLMIDSKFQKGNRNLDELLQKETELKEEIEKLDIDPNHSIEDVITDVKLLHKIAFARRNHRFSTGSLALNNIKLGFVLSEQKNPIDFFTYNTKPSNHLIEEFMLLANKLVAQHLVTYVPTKGLLRNHPPPDPKDMYKVVLRLQKLGYHLNGETAGDLHKSLESFAKKMHKGIPIGKLMLALLVVPMKLAAYFCIGQKDEHGKLPPHHHYALNFDKYTHFTSPIRRYADVIVHRLLTEAEHKRMSKKDSNNNCLTTEKVAVISETCNHRKKNAKQCQELCNKLYLCVWLVDMMHNYYETDAVIIDIGDKAFDIFLLEFGYILRKCCDDIEGANSDTTMTISGIALFINWEEKANEINESKMKNSEIDREFGGYYSILDIAPFSKIDKIKKAFKQQALKWHPDKNKQARAKEEFQKVQNAYAFLKDDSERKKYDSKINKFSCASRGDKYMILDPVRVAIFSTKRCPVELKVKILPPSACIHSQSEPIIVPKITNTTRSLHDDEID